MAEASNTADAAPAFSSQTFTPFAASSKTPTLVSNASRIGARYDKLGGTFLGFVRLASLIDRILSGV